MVLYALAMVSSEHTSPIYLQSYAKKSDIANFFVDFSNTHVFFVTLCYFFAYSKNLLYLCTVNIIKYRNQ